MFSCMHLFEHHDGSQGYDMALSSNNPTGFLTIFRDEYLKVVLKILRPLVSSFSQYKKKYRKNKQKRYNIRVDPRNILILVPTRLHPFSLETKYNKFGKRFRR